jgi:hypothetical protein
MLLLLISVSTLVQAQEEKGYSSPHIFGACVSVGDKDAAVALDWSRLHGIGKKKQRFNIGYGVRYTGFLGANKLYTTAPSKFTSTVQGPGTIFSETIENNIDTLAITKSSQTNSINASIHLQYRLGKAGRAEIGFNIDAIGFSFGSNKTGTIVSSVLDANSPPVVDAKPTVLNLLLTSDNDIGSLNSEFYLRYWLSSKVALKTGFTFYFSEYQTKQKLSFDQGRISNDRFRYKSGMFMLGISWSPLVSK